MWEEKNTQVTKNLYQLELIHLLLARQKVKELQTIKLLIEYERIWFTQRDKTKLIEPMTVSAMPSICWNKSLYSIRLVYDNQNKGKTLIGLTNGIASIHTKCTM